MNRYAFALFALLAAPIMASPAMDEFCVSQGNLAASIMGGRQAGVTLERALEIAATAKPPMNELARGLVLDAYSKPRYMTAAMREQSQSDFRDKVTLTCIITAIEQEEAQ
jgi:hypothetical protein